MSTSEHRTAVALTGLTAALAVASLALAVVLSFTYVPTGSQAWDDPTLGGGTAWTVRHRWVALAWSLAAGASVVATAVCAARSDVRRRPAMALAATVVTGLAATVVLATRPLVQWDQLALWAIEVGTDLDGYWPVFDDGTRFVVIQGTEVAPGDYGVSLAVHLLAHLVGVLAAVGAVAVLPVRRRTRST